MPIVHAWIPDLRFHIIGTGPPEEICEQACEYIVIEGFVENMDEQLASRRLSVAPLRYGSGVKGKINQSMAYGLPCVATPSAVEGMELDWQNEILVAESAHEFAEAVAELYENEEYWTLVAEKSMESIERSFSPRVAEGGMRKILEYHGREVPRA
jgi:glycosyltransferase involved in cell wall biosynthesis